MSTINVFLTHRWDQDDEEYKKIEDNLKNDYYNFKFYSISKRDFEEGRGIDSKIKEGIRNRLHLASVVVTFNNQTTSYTPDSLNAYEINYAKEKGYPIVVVYKQGTDQLPNILNGYSNLIKANWNFASIREKIIEGYKRNNI